MKKSIILTLAGRFLLSKNEGGFISLISWVSILGVMLGVLTLVVVTSVINGFESELARVITGINGDVMLYSRAEPLDGGPRPALCGVRGWDAQRGGLGSTVWRRSRLAVRWPARVTAYNSPDSSQPGPR